MRLPLFPKSRHEIIDEVGKFVGTIKNKDERAYVIKAVNSHEKLVEVIRGALAIKQLWLYPMSKSVTIQQRDEAKALWIMEKQFEQALKEAEK